jgi:hypothetical protein
MTMPATPFRPVVTCEIGGIWVASRRSLEAGGRFSRFFPDADRNPHVERKMSPPALITAGNE